MMRAKLFSGERKTIEFIEDEDGRTLKIHSALELLRFVGLGLSMKRLASVMPQTGAGVSRSEKGSSEEATTESVDMEKPLTVKWGFLSFTFD